VIVWEFPFLKRALNRPGKIWSRSIGRKLKEKRQKQYDSFFPDFSKKSPKNLDIFPVR
jgi:hypothetical protein